MLPEPRRRFVVLLLAAALVLGAADLSLSPDARAALELISADSLRGHVSFLASDLLEGRATPSRGLDIAAEYIAAQFRRAGLEPASGDSYFQTADYARTTPNLEGFSFEVESASSTLRVTGDKVTTMAVAGATFSRTAIFKLTPQNGAQLVDGRAGQLEGKVILVALPDGSMTPADSASYANAVSWIRQNLRTIKPALVVYVSGARPRGSTSTQLLESSALPVPAEIVVADPGFKALCDRLPAGETGAVLSIHMPPPQREPVKLRNVVGVLRGSDPALKDTFVLVSAHYDHLGMRPAGEGDGLFNGANDDASGTAAVIEMAAAFARLREKPRRSILFVTFFGEEKGMLGSSYYAAHPLFPIEKTVADINLEQLGRTDDVTGPLLLSAYVTGFDYSDVGAILQKAGALTGVTIAKHEKNNDSYFSASDNRPLAQAGIPSHTVSVGYIFPDYHRPGDHWEKLDYPNMEKIVRAVAAGVLTIAASDEAPRWNAGKPQADQFRKVREPLQ